MLRATGNWGQTFEGGGVRRRQNAPSHPTDILLDIHSLLATRCCASPEDSPPIPGCSKYRSFPQNLAEFGPNRQ